MPATNLLFTAPIDFSDEVWWQYQKFSFALNCKNATVWVCDPKANFVINDKVLGNSPHLRILATPSTGTNHIDLEACKRRGIKVLSLLDNREALDTISASSEFTFKLILDALRMPPARELQGKRVGLIGYGRIGKRLGKWCSAFGVKAVYIYDPYVPTMITSLEHIFQLCDVVVVCCSLTPETTGMITGDLLRSMKQGAALVNTARGEVIDEEALVAVMQERPDLRVALDVVCGEVTGTADRTRLRNLGAIVTDHVAGETFDSRTKAAQIIYDLLVKELEHE